MYTIRVYVLTSRLKACYITVNHRVPHGSSAPCENHSAKENIACRYSLSKTTKKRFTINIPHRVTFTKSTTSISLHTKLAPNIKPGWYLDSPTYISQQIKPTKTDHIQMHLSPFEVFNYIWLQYRQPAHEVIQCRARAASWPLVTGSRAHWAA